MGPKNPPESTPNRLLGRPWEPKNPGQDGCPGHFPGVSSDQALTRSWPFGVDATIESDTLDRILAELADCLPGFELTLSNGSSGDLIEAAMSGGLDLIVVELPDDAPDRLDAWPLFEHTYHMVLLKFNIPDNYPTLPNPTF